MRDLILIPFIIFIVSCQQAEPIEQNINTQRHFPELKADRYNVAFLIMDGVYNTELTAPFDIFQHTIFRESIKAMNVFLVANTLDPITTFEGMRLLPGGPRDISS